MDGPAPESYETLRRSIASQRNDLSKRLRLIADYAQLDPSAFALRAVAGLAAEIGVAPSAIIRFAQHFGYSGFSEMQNVFRQRLEAAAPSYRDRVRNLEQHGGADATDDMMRRFIEAGIESLKDLQLTISPDKIDEAAGFIADARTVHVLAQKRTFPAAAYLAYNLARLEMPAHLFDGIGGMLEQQSNLIGPDDVVVAISFLPGAQTTADVFSRALDKGARTVAIVDVPRAPYVHADVVFEVVEASVENFRSLTATISLALVLAIRAGTFSAHKSNPQDERQ
ncbi:MurR/RpiR family transcriptional regulator [Rhodobium gokarnense]|uniref:DNA-binding MurR/RpiR family transcriptional regulator n=1 Tax=Rhodobium gokarnense TaxID=364296 RepID=A0ABT3HB81_9HYPH|nr:MurR/RpiR family transcriptional regulator [Rhodobium gokarnense]MCW2307658.1 DNA-binding MurR/RpiR family transcriptional regulator [Rhodobium gokarnense]